MAEAVPPPSFASQDEARGYVSAVLARTPPREPGRVYVIASPLLRQMPAMPKMLAVLGKALPGAELITYDDLPRGRGEMGARIKTLAGGLVVGAVVLPRAWGLDGETVHVVGAAARDEAAALVAAGVPVLVLTPVGLLAWPDVRLVPAPEGVSPRYPWRVEAPGPSSVLLPTVAASYRAMGLPRPAPRRPRAARPARSP